MLSRCVYHGSRIQCILRDPDVAVRGRSIAADAWKYHKVSRIWLTNHSRLLTMRSLALDRVGTRGGVYRIYRRIRAFFVRSSSRGAPRRSHRFHRKRAGPRVPLINMPYNREPPYRPAKGKAHVKRYTGTGGERLISHRTKKGEAESPRWLPAIGRTEPAGI